MADSRVPWTWMRVGEVCGIPGVGEWVIHSIGACSCFRRAGVDVFSVIGRFGDWLALGILTALGRARFSGTGAGEKGASKDDWCCPRPANENGSSKLLLGIDRHLGVVLVCHNLVSIQQTHSERGQTCNDEDNAPCHGNLGLCNLVFAPTVGTLHSYGSHSHGNCPQDNGEHHESPGGLKGGLEARHRVIDFALDMAGALWGGGHSEPLVDGHGDNDIAGIGGHLLLGHDGSHQGGYSAQQGQHKAQQLLTWVGRGGSGAPPSTEHMQASDQLGCFYLAFRLLFGP